MASPDGEWDAMVEGILRANAALSRVLPHYDDEHTSRPHARPVPPSRGGGVGASSGVLDDILSELEQLYARSELQPPSVRGGGRAPPPPSASTAHATAVEARRAAAAEDEGSRCPIDPMRDLHAHGPCAICLGAHTRTAVSALLPCLHRFCYGCITAWLRVGDTCPLCKRPPVAVAYSIRRADYYKLRHLHGEGVTVAALGELGRRDAPSGVAGACAPAGDAAGEAADAAAPPVAPPPRGVAGSADAPYDGPRAVMSRLPDGSLGCSVAEARRVRAALGLPPLRDG